MFCVKFENINKPYFGYIKPYNGVRDNTTYSTTYFLPSMIDGIKYENNLQGNIVRHKLQFDRDGMSKELTSTILECGKWENGEFNRFPSIHNRYKLVNPVVYLLFDNKDDAEKMYQQHIYCGQTEYMIYPSEIFEISEEEFNSIEGVETFETDEHDPNSFFCGFNRFKDNKKMFITIKKTVA